MPFVLALLLAQVGPGGALPQAPLEIPRRKPDPAPLPPSRQVQCAALIRTAPQEALKLAEQWLAETTGSAQVDPAECKALALANLERWAEAEAAFLAARDAVPAHERARRAQFAAAAAIAAEAQGGRDRALALYKAAQEEAAAGGDSTLAGQIARDSAASLFAAGRTDEAMAALAKAREALPDDPATWLISARAARRLGKLAEAQTQIERAAGLDPRDPAIGLEAGVIAVLAGRDEAARKSWQSVIAAAPDSAEAKVAKGYLDQLGPPAASPPR